MRRVSIIICAAAAWSGVNGPAHGEPRAVQPPRAPVYDWTGLYVGGHVGYGRGDAAAVIADPAARTVGGPFGSLFGGVQTGYNHVFRSRLLLGIEADLSFPNYLGFDDLASFADSPNGKVVDRIDYVGSVRGRVGYAFDRAMVYGTGGFAYTHGRFVQYQPDSEALGDAATQTAMRTGWTAGAGVEAALDPLWSVRLEYLYSRFGSAGTILPSGAAYDSSFDLHNVRIGLNRKLDWPAHASSTPADFSPAIDGGRWEVHGQTTYIQQGYPRFRALYTGPNSFTPWPQTRETFTASIFLGLRLWDGGELYYNPELFQGFGLQSTVGAGGYPNGEAQKSNFPAPHYSTSRLFLRQTFELGGEQETVESSYGQMAGKKDISRVTVQVGRFAVKDAFDQNAYASDPRAHFLNWSIWAAGAFDYPADLIGLTYGGVAEINQKNWAFRTGYFLVGNTPNSNNFDTAVFRRGGYVSELETRYTLFFQPGKLRLIGWFHNTYSGGYREAIDLANATPGLDINDAILNTFQSRIKFGYVVNVEQALSDDIGVFGRWSWNDGTNQINAFTDIDASLSAGTAIKGRLWGRPNDTIGIAGAVNGLSKDHRDFLAAGGLGILVGDGRLNYRNERVLETYYGIGLTTGVTLTFDYQLLTNPAYNADRGPISIFATRLHGEF